MCPTREIHIILHGQFIHFKLTKQCLIVIREKQPFNENKSQNSRQQIEKMTTSIRMEAV